MRTKPSFRTDIQALRGVAVLLVVLYHSGLSIFDAGYLGVDMFFVISGFLITGIITRGIRDDKFSFATFYTRRVRRLLLRDLQGTRQLRRDVLPVAIGVRREQVAVDRGRLT